MRRRIGLCALALAGMMLGHTHPGVGEAPDTLKKVPGVRAVGPVSASQAQPASSDQEKALANQLAAALSNAGISVSDQDLNNIVQSLTDGGQAAMALATFLTSSITESNLEASKAPSRGTSLSIAQIDGLIAKLPPDTTLQLTRFLKYKLTQLRKTRPRG